MGTIGGLVHDAVPLTMLLGLGAMNQQARASTVRQASTKDDEYAEIALNIWTLPIALGFRRMYMCDDHLSYFVNKR